MMTYDIPPPLPRPSRGSRQPYSTDLERAHADLQRYVWTLRDEVQKLSSIVAWLCVAVALIYLAAILAPILAQVF